jgi:CO dehydrogenase/acetyl-CoA synthase alpha subunit
MNIMSLGTKTIILNIEMSCGFEHNKIRVDLEESLEHPFYIDLDELVEEKCDDNDDEELISLQHHLEKQIRKIKSQIKKLREE